MLLRAEILRRPPRGVVLAAGLLVFGVMAATWLPGVQKSISRGELAAAGPRYGDLPLSFEPNVGQADSSAQYVVQSGGGVISFSPGEVNLDLPGIDVKEEDGTCNAPSRALVPTGLRLRFVGAHNSVLPSAGATLPGKMNYLLGSDPALWRTNLPTYENVVYRGIYPGIDLTYSGASGRLKSTYTVGPHSDPSLIIWRYVGAEKVTVDEAGALQVRMNGGVVLTEEAPLAWQEIDGRKLAVDVRYAQANSGNISFTLGAYDPAYPLIIDPTLTYSTYLGGEDTDEGFAIAVDSGGNSYTVGRTQSANFPTFNALQNTLGGSGDAFVTKLNAAGNALVYSTYLGGSGNDSGNGIVVDQSGNVYLTGATTSTNFPTTPGSYQPNSRFGVEVFITKLNSTGSALVYSTYLGGSGNEEGNALAVDSAGNAYVTGFTTSPSFPTSNPYQATIHSIQDAFVSKLNPAGSDLVFSTFLGGSVGLGGNYDEGFGIGVDASGSPYVTGLTGSTDFPTANPYQAANGGQFDVFATRFTPSGTALVFSTYLGGSSGDEGHGLALDAQGNVYLTGVTYSPNFPTVNAYQQGQGGGGDAFIVRLNGSGLPIYSTYLGGNGFDIGYGVALDSLANAYITGYTISSNFPLADPYQSILRGPTDAFVTGLNAAGSGLVYSTYLGGASYEHGNAIAVDAQGSAYVTGDTYSVDFPVENAYQPVAGDRIDAFVSKLSVQPVLTPTVTPTVCTNNPNYTVFQDTDTVFPGTNIVLGSQADDAVIPFALPFPIQLYGQTYNTANLSTNGNMQFTTANPNPNNTCLPAADMGATIFTHWDDLDMRSDTCGARCGIFTDVSGPVGSRTLIIHWKGIRPGVPTSSVDVAVRFEEETANERFEIIYTQVLGNGTSATVGVQNGDGSLFTQFSCNTPSLSDGMRLVFTRYFCPVTVTPTTAVATATATPTRTITSPTAATSTPISTPTLSPSPVPTCGTASWNIVSSPNIGAGSNALNALSAVAPDDAWAVGYYSDLSNREQALVERWDGSQWSAVPAPTPGQASSLQGVVALAPDNVWATGYSVAGTEQTLMEHWNGTEWTVVPSPNAGACANRLTSLSATAPDDIWAAGYSVLCTGGTPQTLTMHWDGTAWTIVPSPNVGSGGNQLHGLTAITPADVWAVGYYVQGTSNLLPLSLHWDGLTWTVVPMPDRAGYVDTIQAVDALSTNDVWAVGASSGDQIPSQTLIEHWDGSAWSIIASPNMGPGSNVLRGVKVLSPSSVWAVGRSTNPNNATAEALSLNWNGGGWNIVTNPSVPQAFNELRAIDGLSTSDVWSAGFYSTGNLTRTLIEHFTGPCGTPTAIVSVTPTIALTPSVTPLATSTMPTACPIQFSDVPSTNTFYSSIRCLACRGIVSGYADGTFRPNNQVTRGQLAKMVSNAAGFSEAVSGQTFEDVTPANTFYEWIERLTTRGYMTGYICGGPGEPCTSGRPYFRPFANATRGQTSKIVANAAGFTEPPSGQTFEDVPPSHTFYEFIQRLASRNVMGGYPCGGVGEPCVSGKPFFRPGNDVTRGQSSKIVANTFFPNCDPFRR